MRPRARMFLCGAGLLLGSTLLAAALDPQAPEEEEEDEEEAGNEEARKTSDWERRILNLFTATSKEFDKDGKLVLFYDFETKNQDLVEDWKPHLDQTKMRIRWARGIEGTIATIEHGILISDSGQWLHKAMFLGDLEVKVDHLSVAQFRSRTILAPIFFNEKKRRSIGVSGGYQAVCLNGHKLAKPPYPKDEKLILANIRQTIGYKYNGKVLESYLRNKKTSDTSPVRGFTEGFDVGRVGLAWSGSVQSFIFSVHIRGRLDPDWVARELGEEPAKPSTKKARKP